MKNTKNLFSLIALGASLSLALPAHAGTDDYIGEIFMMGSNFCPRGSAPANGQLLPVSQNQALFSLLGTTYGGDGRTTFALPDLRGRSPIHAGQGPGLSNYRLGSKGGTENNALNSTTINNKTKGNKPPSGDDTVDVAVPGQLNNLSPYQAIQYCVVLQGTYPSRN